MWIRHPLFPPGASQAGEGQVGRAGCDWKLGLKRMSRADACVARDSARLCFDPSPRGMIRRGRGDEKKSAKWGRESGVEMNRSEARE